MTVACSARYLFRREELFGIRTLPVHGNALMMQALPDRGRVAGRAARESGDRDQNGRLIAVSELELEGLFGWEAGSLGTDFSSACQVLQRLADSFLLCHFGASMLSSHFQPLTS
jgi:hypothetical protein